MTADFLQQRITSIQAQIVAYENAIIALASGGIQSYTIDTGQSRQTVTKLDLKNLNDVLNSLMNQLAIYEARLTGNGTVIGRPAW